MNAHVSSAPGDARRLVDRLSSCLANEKRELVLFLIELGELDARNLALELGYPSTLGCLVKELGLTESSACRRIAAARLLARFPQIAGYLLSSRLTLMGLVALKDVIDEVNVDVLERSFSFEDRTPLGRFGCGFTRQVQHALREARRATRLDLVPRR